jgi:hypothetical protein
MVLTLSNVEKLLMNDNVIQVSYVYSNVTPKFWVTTKQIVVKLSAGEVITIPKGFTTDFCTVPKLLWGLFPPYGDFLLASLIHDYLYLHRPDNITRARADKEMLLWSKVLNGDRAYDAFLKYYWKRFDNYIRYGCVRLFGWTYWKHLFKFSNKSKPI